MRLYGIINDRSGRLLSLLASSRLSDDSSAEVTSSRRNVAVTGVIEVGDFMRQPLFVTDDLELVVHLLATGVGNEFHNEITLSLPFGAKADDLAIVDVSTMARVDPGQPGAELAEAIARHLAATRP